MALLTVDQRKKRFKALGLGEYNEKNILKFQKKAFPKHKAEHDSKYGPATDRALRHFYNCSLVKDFKPEEFRCDCGRCNGYPSYMKQVELKNLQKIRTHYGKPMTVTSGLRCSYSNSASRGSVPNSGHLHGYACDFYMPGVTDTLANRKRSIKYMKSLDNTQYVYGNGINSYGASVQAAYMGNAMHYETHQPPKKKKVTKTADPLQKWFDAMETQFKWSKDQLYYFVKPTVASSRKKGTCITFPAVSLQRLGLIPKGAYFYFHPQKLRISGTAASYVKNHPDIFKLSYPNKTIKDLWKAGKIQKGDIVGYGNPGYHTMVFMGMKDGQPIFNTMGHKRGLKVTYPSYAKRKVNMLVRIKKVR